MKIAGTREQILDVAEALFAKNGFHATSVREITAVAGVTLAGVNYHFGTKEGLYEKVFERGLQALSNSCREKLDAVRSETAETGEQPIVEKVLNAFLEPMLCPQEPNRVTPAFYLLLGRAMISPQETIEVRYLEPLFLLLYENLRAVSPVITGEFLAWRLRFAFGAIGHALQGTAAKLLFDSGTDPSCDANELLGMLIGFLAAGIEAPFDGSLSQSMAADQGFTQTTCGFE